MDMPLLNQADSAYQALTPAYKDSFPDTLSSKMETLDDHVTKATLSNLHELLLHYNFYIFERDLAFCNLTSVEEEKLRQIADCVRMNPKVKLKVVGYACNEGSRSRAEMLSYERARYIREFILNCGWTQSRFCWITRWSESLRSPRMPSRCAACTAACRWYCSDIENAINESILTDDILQKKLIRNFSVYQNGHSAGVPIFCVCAVCFIISPTAADWSSTIPCGKATWRCGMARAGA